MRNPPPPAHYNPPPMFGLRTRRTGMTLRHLTQAEAEAKSLDGMFGPVGSPLPPNDMPIFDPSLVVTVAELERMLFVAAPPLTSGTDAEP